MCDADQIEPPKVSIEKCREILKNTYGLTCQEITELNGYDDKNYKIVPSELCDNKHLNLCRTGYVLKIMNSTDSKNINLIEAQNAIMLNLVENNVTCTKVVKNKYGEYCSKVSLVGSDFNVVRLLEFVPGAVLKDIRYTDDIFYEIGKFVAHVDVILKKFHHKAYDKRKFIWMLSSAPELRKYLYVVENGRDKNIIESVVSNFEERVMRKVDLFEKGIIHGDFNEQNIIIQNNNSIGIIDFGDSQYNCYLFELAITLTYMMLITEEVTTGGHVIAGYSTVRKIPEQEFEVLKVCVEARLCQSIVLGLYYGIKNPDNTYIMCTQEKGWKLLKKLHDMPEKDLHEKWNCILTGYNNK